MMPSDRFGVDLPEYEARLRDRIRELEQDAAQRRRSRDAIRVREARLVEATRMAGLGNWEWDVVHDEIYWSDEMYRIFGVTREQFTATYEGFLERVHREDRHSIREQIEATFERNAPFMLEFRIVRPDGSQRYLWGKGSVRRDSDGCVVRLAGTCQDVTDQKREEAERQQLIDQVQRSRRLEGLAVLAQGLSNDFRNLLTAIEGQAELARDALTPDSPIREHLDQILDTVTKSARLTDRLSACSGSPPARLEPVDLNEVVSRCMDDFDRRLTLHASVRYDLWQGLPHVRGDFDQLCQVVSALVENAGQAIVSANGSIVLATGVLHIDSAHLAGAYLADDLPEGMYAYVRVVDNGCGLDDVAVEHVFDPFYSTKGPGRGLGLAWVAGVVRSHRGAIIVNSEPTRGSTFTVVFPASPVPAASVPTEPTPPDDWMDSGSILVVDDEPAVRSVVKILLERRGFDVVVARDGAEGLELIEQLGDMRAVLLDLNMPRMNGEETFERVRELRPEIPVVVMTGTADHGMVERLRRRTRVRVLLKPFRAAALVDRLRAALYGDAVHTAGSAVR